MEVSGMTRIIKLIIMVEILWLNKVIMFHYIYLKKVAALLKDWSGGGLQ